MNTCSHLGVTLPLIIQHHHLSLNSCLNHYWHLALLKSWDLATSPWHTAARSGKDTWQGLKLFPKIKRCLLSFPVLSQGFRQQNVSLQDLKHFDTWLHFKVLCCL